MLNSYNEEVKTIVFNTPESLSLELLFSDLKSKDLPKVKYLIHQINYYHNRGGYEVHIKKHSWTLGVKDGVLTSILRRLIDNDIVYISSPASKGYKSNTYSMISPFDITNSSKSFYQVREHLFLQKLVCDNFIAKGKEGSSFNKGSKSDDKAFIADLKQQVKELQAEVLRLSPSTPERVEHSQDIPKVDELVTDLSDGMLFITQNETSACICNYDEMSGWCDPLSVEDRKDLFKKLISASGTTLKYKINKVTSVLMRCVDEDNMIYNYSGLEVI